MELFSWLSDLYAILHIAVQVTLRFTLVMSIYLQSTLELTVFIFYLWNVIVNEKKIQLHMHVTSEGFALYHNNPDDNGYYLHLSHGKKDKKKRNICFGRQISHLLY